MGCQVQWLLATPSRPWKVGSEPARDQKLLAKFPARVRIRIRIRSRIAATVVHSAAVILKFRRVTIRGAQPSARLSEEIYLSEGSTGVSQRPLGGGRVLRGLCGVLRVSAGFSEVFWG